MSRVRMVNQGGQVRLLKNVVFDGWDFGLLTPYIDGANRVFMARSGHYIRRSDHPLYRYWRIPKNRLLDELDIFFHQLTGLCSSGVLDSWQSFQAQVSAALSQPARDAFTWGLSLRIAPLDEGGVLLSGDFHPGVVAAARRMQGSFLGRSKSWRINSTIELVRSNLILDLGLAEEQIEVITTTQTLLDDGSVASAETLPGITIGGPPAERQAAVATGEVSYELYLAAVPTIERTEFSEEQINQALQGYSLLGHQPAGIHHLLMRTGALLADDMGLGKTRQGIIAAHIRAAGRPILVITLNTLLVNWQREIHAVYPDASVSIQTINDDAQWTLVNFERLEAQVAIAGKYQVMIVDEAQTMKEPTAAWTRNGFDIAAQVPNRYLLTGTPVLNREAELHTLLRLSGHPIGQLPLKDFCNRFAGSPEFRQSLRAEIQDWMLRRRKDVLPDLKGKQRQLLSLALTDAERKEYDKIRLSEKPIFARLGAMRQLLEQFKIKHTIEMLTALDPLDKIILFCEFKPTVAQLEERCTELGIGCVTLIGSDSLRKRQKSIDTFQEDPDCRVFICTTKAAGTGNNLTAANYVSFLGLPWTPGQQDQAEDRAYRNGQLRMVVVKIPLYDNTIDQQLWELLMAKRKVSQELIEHEADLETLTKAAMARTLTA